MSDTAADLRALMVTYVDHAGIARVKIVPGRRLASVARSGATASLSAATLFSTDDYPVSTPALDATTGDVRVVPDLDRLVMLDAESGLGWVPSDLRSLDGTAFPTCPRGALRAVAQRANDLDLEVLIGLELEFSLFVGPKASATNSHTGPGYGVLPFLELESFHLDLLEQLERCGVPVEQLHPEYGKAQVELSFAPRDPLSAVDDFMLARTIVTRVALRHGFVVSFAPVPTLGEATNGVHIHLSATRDGRNVFHAPGAVDGIAPEGAAMIAGVLASLHEGIALLGGTTTSFSRLQPHNWAGAYICWGDGNREAAVRLMRGFAGSENDQANIEVKCADGSSNQYLAVAAVLAAALRGPIESLVLTPGVDVEPGTLSSEEQAELGVAAFPSDLRTALDALDASSFYREALGNVLIDTYVAVRRHDWETYGHLPPAEATQASRWHY
ncbi:MAG: glutamine synthetase [Leifsonia sp.]|nr:glutamine synthetase [Leifsonia sp.]